MGKRKSLIKQGVDKLMSMAAFGQSKHEDKKQNGGHPARDKIYGTGTMDNYIDAVSRFLRWVRIAISVGVWRRQGNMLQNIYLVALRP